MKKLKGRLVIEAAIVVPLVIIIVWLMMLAMVYVFNQGKEDAALQAGITSDDKAYTRDLYYDGNERIYGVLFEVIRPEFNDANRVLSMQRRHAGGIQ